MVNIYLDKEEKKIVNNKILHARFSKTLIKKLIHIIKVEPYSDFLPIKEPFNGL